MSKVYSNEWMENQGFFDIQDAEVPEEIKYIK